MQYTFCGTQIDLVALLTIFKSLGEFDATHRRFVRIKLTRGAVGVVKQIRGDDLLDGGTGADSMEGVSATTLPLSITTTTLSCEFGDEGSDTVHPT